MHTHEHAHKHTRSDTHIQTWREYPCYCRPPASIRSLRSLSAVVWDGPHLTSQRQPPTPTPFVCPALSMLKIKHTTLICSFVARWLSPNSYIFQFWRKYIFMCIVIFSWKGFAKSKYSGFYALIFTKVGRTCSQRAMSRGSDLESTLALPGMREMEARQLQLGHYRHAKWYNHIRSKDIRYLCHLLYDISTMLY